MAKPSKPIPSPIDVGDSNDEGTKVQSSQELGFIFVFKEEEKVANNHRRHLPLKLLSPSTKDSCQLNNKKSGLQTGLYFELRRGSDNSINNNKKNTRNSSRKIKPYFYC